MNLWKEKEFALSQIIFLAKKADDSNAVEKILNQLLPVLLDFHQQCFSQYNYTESDDLGADEILKRLIQSFQDQGNSSKIASMGFDDFEHLEQLAGLFLEKAARTSDVNYHISGEVLVALQTFCAEEKTKTLL